MLRRRCQHSFSGPSLTATITCVDCSSVYRIMLIWKQSVLLRRLGHLGVYRNLHTATQSNTSTGRRPQQAHGIRRVLLEFSRNTFCFWSHSLDTEEECDDSVDTKTSSWRRTAPMSLSDYVDELDEVNPYSFLARNSLNCVWPLISLQKVFLKINRKHSSCKSLKGPILVWGGHSTRTLLTTAAKLKAD